MSKKQERFAPPPVPPRSHDRQPRLPSWSFWPILPAVMVVALGVWTLRGERADAPGPQQEKAQGTRARISQQVAHPLTNEKADTSPGAVAAEVHAEGSPPLDATDVLDPTKQKYIWDAEHVTFEIEKRFGKIFKAAWEARDEEKLAALFQNDFQGIVIDGRLGEEPTSRQKGLLSEWRLERADTNSRTVDSAGLIDDLLSLLRNFDETQQLGLRVLNIERLETDSGHRWSTQLLLTASGRDAHGGLLALDSLQRVELEYRAEREIDGGRVVSRWDVRSKRLRTCPRMLLEEVTEEVGLAKLPLQDNWLSSQTPQQFRFQMAVEDFNRDGYLDIAIASVNGFPVLLRSVRGEHFENVTKSFFGLIRWRPDQYQYLAAWIDYDNDGFPDLLLGSRLYRNVKGEYFSDVTAQSGLRFGERPMGCAVADYDADGLLDLYVLYQFSSREQRTGPIPWVGDDQSGQENQLWHNEGNGQFRDVTETAGAGGGLRNSFAAAWLYADQDSLPDLYVANDFGTNVMLRNRGDGSFEDISAESGVADYATSMGVAAGDVDNDGLPELYVANMYSKMGRRIIAHVGPGDYSPGIYEQIKGACAGNRLYRRGSDDSNYREMSTPLGVNDIGWAFAPAFVDLDNDGLLDLYATTGFMSFDRHKPDG